jgi:hypothetical protein
LAQDRLLINIERASWAASSSIRVAASAFSMKSV